jgi:hypothetical protein
LFFLLCQRLYSGRTIEVFKITGAQRDIIGNLKKGDKVYFDNIKAVGPDGKPRELPTISFKNSITFKDTSYAYFF